jgi:hypothetical protein
MNHKAGRPPRFKNPYIMQQVIDKYFYDCDHKVITHQKVKDGKIENIDIPAPEPYTMTGLAEALNLSRQALMEYKNSDRFGDTIKKARQKVEKSVEILLLNKGHIGIIFNLKNNFNWKDKTESDDKLKISGGLTIKRVSYDNNSTGTTGSNNPV